MIAPRLLGLRRNRPEAVLAEPDSRARCACRRSAHAQQLQQRLAPRQALRRCALASLPASRSVSAAMVILPASDFHQMNALRIVRSQIMRRVGSGGNVARRTAHGFQCRHARLGALALDHLPRGVIDRHAILAHDQRVGLPEALGMKARPAIINRTHRVANGEANLLANRGNAIQVGDGGVAAVGVQFERAV